MAKSTKFIRHGRYENIKPKRTFGLMVQRDQHWLVISELGLQYPSCSNPFDACRMANSMRMKLVEATSQVGQKIIHAWNLRNRQTT